LQASKRFEQSVTDAFLETVIADDCHDLDRDPRPPVSEECEKFGLWYAQYGTGVLYEAEREYFELMHRRILDARNPPRGRYSGSGTSDAERDAEMYSARLADACAGNRLFLTDQGSMGLCPPSAGPGDTMVFIPSGKYPFVLRSCEGADGVYSLVGQCFLYDWWCHLAPVFELGTNYLDRFPALAKFVIR
jgi:hypothetical protein